MCIHWVWIGAALVLVAAVAWRVLGRPQDWKPLNERMVDQVSRSAELARECSRSITEGRPAGRISTLR